MSEHHAQNVARGHKAAISNPDVSEEAKQNSRRAIEEIEGSSNPNDFTASVGSDKASGYDSQRATHTVGNIEEKKNQRTNEPSRLFPEGEFDRD